MLNSFTTLNVMKNRDQFTRCTHYSLTNQLNSLTTIVIINSTPFHITHTHSAQITTVTGYRDLFEYGRLRPEAIRRTELSFCKDNCQDHLEESERSHTSPTSPKINLELIWYNFGNTNSFNTELTSCQKIEDIFCSSKCIEIEQKKSSFGSEVV